MLNKKLLVLLSAILLAVGGVNSHAAGKLKKVTGLKSPESVVVGPNSRIYVSEIGEFDKDGDGQISVIGDDGKARPYANGMNDPKGLVFSRGVLYVADKTRILRVEKGGKWNVFVPAEAFPAKPVFLNDLEADSAGNIYVSDSGNIKENTREGAIYRIGKDSKPVVVINATGNIRLVAPNGLLMDGNDSVMEVDFLSGRLYRIVLNNGVMNVLAEGFGGGDGLVRGRNGLLYLSDWANGRIFSLSKGGEVKLISADFKAPADMTLAPGGKHLLVPDMKAGELVWLPIP